MIKTATIYKLADSATRVLLNQVNFPLVVKEPTIVDPDPSAWASIGFSHPDYFGDTTVFCGAAGVCVFNVQIRERVLPGKVIRTKLAERAASLASRQGYKPSRKVMAELKEEIVASLLPSSHIKPVDILCMVAGGYLIIGTGSARVVDEVIALLRNTFSLDGELVFRSIDAHREVHKWMTELLLNDTTDSGRFSVGVSVTLKDREKGSARFKDIGLDSETIQAHVTEGMHPVEIAVNHLNDNGDVRLMFSLSERLVVKRIALSDVLIEQAVEDGQGGDPVTQFDATVAIVSGAITDMLNDLLDDIPNVEEEL